MINPAFQLWKNSHHLSFCHYSNSHCTSIHIYLHHSLVHFLALSLFHFYFYILLCVDRPLFYLSSKPAKKSLSYELSWENINARNDINENIIPLMKFSYMVVSLTDDSFIQTVLRSNSVFTRVTRNGWNRKFYIVLVDVQHNILDCNIYSRCLSKLTGVSLVVAVRSVTISCTVSSWLFTSKFQPERWNRYTPSADAVSSNRGGTYLGDKTITT